MDQWISLGMWATELDTSLSSSISQPASMNISTSGNRTRYVDTELDSSRTVNGSVDQFRYVGNRARYEFIELDISPCLDEHIDLY